MPSPTMMAVCRLCDRPMIPEIEFVVWTAVVFVALAVPIVVMATVAWLGVAAWSRAKREWRSRA